MVARQGRKNVGPGDGWVVDEAVRAVRHGGLPSDDGYTPGSASIAAAPRACRGRYPHRCRLGSQVAETGSPARHLRRSRHFTEGLVTDRIV
jgi:hypothetical protein